MIRRLNDNAARLSLAFFMLWIFLPAIAAGQSTRAITIEAFGVSQKPFTDLQLEKKVDICYIDQYQTRLSNIKKAARQVAFNNLPGAKWRALSGKGAVEKFKDSQHAQLKQLAQVFRCCGKAKLLGVHKIPAIVFAKKYVVYGETDFVRAYHAYQSFLRQQNNKGGLGNA